MEDFKQSIKYTRYYADHHHKNDKYGQFDYIYHLDKVYEILRDNLNCNLEVLQAAYLHDIIEDTPITYQDVVDEFGITVADIVEAVTDEPGKNRKERKAKTYPKIKGFKDATLVKFADRIANLTASVQHRNIKKIKMYLSERDEFIEWLDMDDPDVQILKTILLDRLEKCQHIAKKYK